MFSADVVVNNGTANVTYSQISLENSKSIRNDATRGIAYPRSLVISHEVAGSGLKASDRHLVRFNDVKADPTSTVGGSVSASCYTVLDVPRRVFTHTDIAELVKSQIAFWTDANLAKILNGEP